MISLELHKSAKTDFDVRGNSLLARIRVRSDTTCKPRGFSPDMHVDAKLTDVDIIGEIRSTTVDDAGTELARYFSESQNEVGLEGEDYREFEKLIESIQRTQKFKNTISQTRLKEVVFDWFRDSRKLATGATLCDYIIEVCSPEICDYEVAIPIATLSVEVEFPVGCVVIRPLTKEVLDGWFQAFIDRAQSEEERKKIDASLVRKRKELQGYSAAFVSVQAEHTRAKEVALQEAEVALGLLRYFADGSRSSRCSCACVPLGKESIHQFKAISFNDGVLQNWSEGVVNSDWPAWVITAAGVSRIRTAHLDALSEIYRNPQTKIHRQIIDAVLLFSRVAIAHEPSDKLILLLASIESLFLKNQSEPIQQNLGERLAILAGNNLEEKKDILATTRRIYGLRSKFVHHGEGIDDVALMDKFMVYAWRGIFNVISNRDRFASLEEFLEKIDERKLAL